MVAEILISLAAIPLRLILGIIFIFHGAPKIRHPERTATHFLKLGIPLPKLSAIIIGIIEFFGGIALLIGFSTRIAAALLAINMLIATYKRKTKMKEEFMKGYGVELILVAALIALVFLGAGILSVDNTFGWLLG